MDESEIKRRIEELQPWGHDVDLGNGIRTGTFRGYPNDPSQKWHLIGDYFPEDMSGMSVLDVGCNSGYNAIQCKLRGAKRVVAIDHDKRCVGQAKFLSEYFNAPLEVSQQDFHIYTLTNDEHFDYVIFSRVFYHLKYANLVLDRLAEMTKKRLVILTETVGPDKVMTPDDNYPMEEKKRLLDSEYPKAFFVEKKYAGDKSNWWVLNESCCSALLRSAGLKIIAHPRAGVYAAERYKEIEKQTINVKKLYFPSLIFSD